ncbi:transcriptional regulator, GntR family [Necator americanus]|uniref:Transcriptional regulator, GntR family n=1 Tax=Necator americanus TaxID=51031 RepID=W2TNG9_NECAM|nr:transcriptional regulator, GntR family [Necator americanus]ETN83298.1 transcriptional regulator, GntR family [Necator americanus]
MPCIATNLELLANDQDACSPFLYWAAPIAVPAGPRDLAEACGSAALSLSPWPYGENGENSRHVWSIQTSATTRTTADVAHSITPLVRLVHDIVGRAVAEARGDHRHPERRLGTNWARYCIVACGDTARGLEEPASVASVIVQRHRQLPSFWGQCVGTGVVSGFGRTLDKPYTYRILTPPWGDQSFPEKLGELAYQTLRRMILDKALRSGGAVVEGRLAEELNISRTPMREALLRLEGEGLLVRAGARSYSVRFVSVQEYFQAMKVREMLEVEAVGLAVGKIEKKHGQQEQAHWQVDDQIHTLMARAGGNDVLARTIDIVRTNSRLFELATPFNRIEEDRVEHLAILEACLAEDVELARNAMRTHLQNLRRFVIERLAEGSYG